MSYTGSPAEQELVTSYSGLMSEVKVRVGAIDTIVRGKVSLPSPIVREICYLQLRMVYEVIALACLVAHGDIKSKKLMGTYEPDKILKDLGRLRPNFFPSPVSKVDKGDDVEISEIHGAHFLTKDELIRMHGKCGNFLHKGSMKNLLSKKTPVEKNYKDVAEASRLQRLLSVHMVSILEEKKMLVCVMNASDRGGAVNVAVAHAIPH